MLFYFISGLRFKLKRAAFFSDYVVRLAYNPFMEQLAAAPVIIVVRLHLCFFNILVDAGQEWLLSKSIL